MKEGIVTINLREQIIQQEQQHVVQSYRRPPFVLTNGEGMTVYDSDGNAYLDWVAGIAVNSLGYGDSEIIEAIQQAATGLLHTSNLYHTAPHAQLATQLCEHSFADRVFFCNSGAEANEGAIKFSRKVAYMNERHDKREIVAFTGAFHGRTMGALALTPREKYQKPFAPLMGGTAIAEFNNIDSARVAIGEQTAAVIVEPIQGEGGINVADQAFLQALRDLCDEHDALLIFDEIQCGVGRTGTLWAYEHYEVIPDILTVAKPLAAGLPIGAILMTEKVASAIQPGDHGSTFAGGPLVTSVAGVVLNRVRQPSFLEHVAEVGDYLIERLSEINSPLIKAVRGRGLIVAVEMTVDVSGIVNAGYEHGLLLVNAGPNVLRFVPPLIAEKHHVDTMIERLLPILQQVEG
ncbi:MAG: aspartate aminotransferase family protein [Chloroflexi bacterium]|nr:MAG: aspartate aminotransferase family protein [Phototrophicales bacterium]RMF80363.1 MAG: aspartate aminotransferase family protein [Chloroflexota bacterium]